MSEVAKVALLQEVMREAKRNERSGLVVCIIGVIIAVAGFSTPAALAGNSFNLGVIGVVVAAVGFVIYLYYARIYLRFVGQLASMITKTASPCPKCGRPLPEGDFAYCPYCGTQLKS